MGLEGGWLRGPQGPLRAVVLEPSLITRTLEGSWEGLSIQDRVKVRKWGTEDPGDPVLMGKRPAEVDYVTEGDTKQQLQGDGVLPSDSSIAVKQGTGQQKGYLRPGEMGS